VTTHVIPGKTYFLVFAVLMALTAIMVMSAYANLGSLNNVVVLALACVQAGLVVLYSMHVRYSEKFIQTSVIISVFFVAILLSLTLADAFSRGWIRPSSYIW